MSLSYLYRTYWEIENVILCEELEDFCFISGNRLVSTQEYPTDYVLEKTNFSKWYFEDPETVFSRLLKLAKEKGHKLKMYTGEEELPYTINSTTESACGSKKLYQWILDTELGEW